LKPILNNGKANLNINIEIIEPQKALYWIAFFAGFLIKLTYFNYSVGLNFGSILTSPNSRMFISTFFFLLLVAAIVFVLFNKKRYIALLVVDVLITILLVADILYFRYYRCPITLPVLAQISLVAPAGDSINVLLNPSDVILILEIPVLLRLLFLFRKSGVKSIPFPTRLVTGVLVAAISIGALRLFYKNSDIPMFNYDRNYVAKELGILYFHVYDVQAYVNENILTNKVLTKEDKQLIEEFYANKSKVPKTDNYHGIAQGKNLIMMQLESFQAFLLNREIDGREITPNLNKLLKESVFFENFHYQVGGGNTSDAEFLSNNSLYPAQQGAVYFRYPGNTYHSLPKLLKKQGYDTYVFHAYHPSFWNRANMYKAVGFDKFYSSGDFITPAEEIEGWGLGDKSFLLQSLEKIDKSKPFYSFMITLSSHYAYGSFEDNDEFDVGEYEGTTFGNYIKAAHYVDSAIGGFLEELKKQGLYDNTLLVFYGDHHAFPKDKSEDMQHFLGIDDSEFEWLKYQKVPLIIHYPGLKNGEVMDITGGQIDILPTVANLMGFEVPYAMGKDLLNSEEGYAILRGGSYITDSYIYISNLGEAFDKKTGRKLEEKEYEKDFERFEKELEVSDTILHKNAFKYKLNIK